MFSSYPVYDKPTAYVKQKKFDFDKGYIISELDALMAGLN